MAAWYDKLDGPNRDGAAALIGMFEEYGLGTLAPKIIEFLQQGYGSDTIYMLLQETPEWEQRFIANKARRKAGLSVLSPNEYIQTERAYRQALQAAGMPKGFYDTQKDFTDFLIKDISPSEIAERATAARELADTVDAEGKRSLARSGLGTGDYAAFLLDVNRAYPELRKQVDVALLNAERKRAGYGYNDQFAEEMYRLGVTLDDAREGYNVIQTQLPTLKNLAEISGIEYGVEDIESEVFGGNAESTKTRTRLASAERARLSGSGGTGSGTLTKDRRFN